MRTIKLVTLMLAGATLAARPAHAKLHGETVEYKQGDAVLEGYLAYDDAVTGKRPAVLVVHDWTGVNDQIKKRVDMLAGLGYIALAADVYGKGIRPTDPARAAAEAGKYKAGDRSLMRARATAGLEFLAKNKFSDTSHLAAIGYCFGGTTALELARSGAPLVGVVSFHGGLDTPHPQDATHIKGKVLALHGGDDPFVPADQVAGFEKEMRDAKVDWQLTAYGGAVHAFTMPKAGNDNSKGAAYNEKADRRSWEAMKIFLGEVFGGKK